MNLFAVARFVPLALGVLGARAGASTPGDPPPRVARLSYLGGSVSFEPSGDTTWGQATLNYPVSIGDRLYADQGARAELQIGTSTFRVSGSTDVTMTNLTDALVQLGLSDGTLRASVYDLEPDDSIEIDTPNGSLTILSPGAYRVEVDADDSTTLVSVDSGSVSVSVGGGTQVVGSGEAVQLSAMSSPAVEVAVMPPQDSFDQWSAERDARRVGGSSRQYVSGGGSRHSTTAGGLSSAARGDGCPARWCDAPVTPRPWSCSSRGQTSRGRERGVAPASRPGSRLAPGSLTTHGITRVTTTCVE